jgi:2-polyprenyl-3-methyl-5-hydroxy-6-metoxy-1,4-benzoquinol methylase
MSNALPTENAAESAVTAPTIQPSYVWQRYLNVEESSYIGNYHEHVNPNFVKLFAHSPRKLLDIGCANGALLAEMKRRDALTQTIGIEPNRHAVDIARSRVDRVFHGKFEDIDLAAEGFPHGSIDSVVAADVLEHMYDPWQTMVNLKPFLTPDGQVIISIPNSRHVSLIAGLADGGLWTYADRGLLDITHIRFFTLKEFAKLLEQTGYRMERVDYYIDPPLVAFFNDAQTKPEINMRVGRMSLERLTKQELTELCTLQLFIRARPA